MPIIGTPPQPSQSHGATGMIAMLGTVLPLVKFTVEVFGGAPSPFHVARNPPERGETAVTLTATARTCEFGAPKSSPRTIEDRPAIGAASGPCRESKTRSGATGWY